MSEGQSDSYWVTQKLPQIYTANYTTFPIRIRKITVQICGHFWVTQYIVPANRRRLPRGWNGEILPRALSSELNYCLLWNLSIPNQPRCRVVAAAGNIWNSVTSLQEDLILYVQEALTQKSKKLNYHKGLSTWMINVKFTCFKSLFYFSSTGPSCHGFAEGNIFEAKGSQEEIKGN